LLKGTRISAICPSGKKAIKLIRRRWRLVQRLWCTREGAGDDEEMLRFALIEDLFTRRHFGATDHGFVRELVHDFKLNLLDLVIMNGLTSDAQSTGRLPL
jgi:hypothetical protein